MSNAIDLNKIEQAARDAVEYMRFAASLNDHASPVAIGLNEHADKVERLLNEGRDDG